MSNEITISLNYEILNNKETTSVEAFVYDSDDSLDQMINELQTQIEELSISMDNLVNNADSLDYAIAVSSGIISSIIDIFFIKTFNLDFTKTKEEVFKSIENFVIKQAKKHGYTKDNLDGAIRKNEKLYKVRYDNIWNNHEIKSEITTFNHHLADFAHHPTLFGLLCSVFEQVFHYAFFVDKDGEHFFFKTESGIDHNFIGTIVLSGLFSWIANIIQDNMSEKLDINIPKPIRKLINLIQFTPSIVKVLKMTDLWWGHLVSDMAGTSSSAKRGNTGMGIPGPFVSFIQTLGVLNPKMAHVADEMFASDKRIDMRQELTYIKGFTKELGKQTVPLIVNETLVRGFYFIRHLVLELQEKQELEEVDWANVIPLGNRTVERMITISTGVFTGIDALDAIVEGAINSKGSWAGFMKNTVLRLNFVGIGRFTVALGNDFYKGYQLSKKNDEVYLLRCKQLYLLNAKVFYKDQQVWQLAENVDESMSELFTLLSTTLVQSSNMIEDAINKIENISVDDLDEQNEGLSTEILDIIS